jgi:carbonic anhydrase
MAAMAFNWEPFGRTRTEEPAAAAEPPRRRRELPRTPSRQLAVLTCMDCRIDPLQTLGLRLGDAVVLRNAGAQASDDVLRSLRMAHEALGVTAVHVVGHTDCAAHRGDDKVSAAAAHRSADRIRATLPALRVEASLLDVRTGAVSRPAGAPPPSG